MATSLEFKLPLELSPMPTMASDDEESFVILGKSLMPEVDASMNNLHLEPISSGPIEEGKKLINMELSRLDTPGSQEQEQNICGTSVSLSPEEVQQKVDTLIAENIKLRDTIMKNNIAMESQHEKIVAWKEEVQKTHSAHKQKFGEAKEFITKLKADKETLTAELFKCREIKDMYEKELLELKDELKQTQNNSASSKIGLNNDEELLISAQKISELQNLLQTVTAANNRLSDENERLKLNSSKTEQLDPMLEIKKRDEAIVMLTDRVRQSEEAGQKIIKSLNTEVINLRSQLCMTVNLEEDLDNARRQLMNSQSTITSLQQTNAVLMAQLATEEENVKRLKECESMKEDYFALQQQVDLYKADFEAERTAKENLKTEKDQIITDFLQIQKRNNELNEEIELLKERGFEVIGSGRRSTSSTSSSNASTQAKKYGCPICSFGFLTYEALENHVERCMDLSASLP